MLITLSESMEKDLRATLRTYRGRNKFDMYFYLYRWGIISKENFIKSVQTIINFEPIDPNLNKRP